jgi:hypothetical protein
LEGFDPGSPASIAYHDTGAGQPVSAEALFEWNAEDGLENGVYDVYLDMGRYTPTFREGDMEVLGGAAPDEGNGLLTMLGRALYCAGDALVGTPGTLPPLLEMTRADDLTVDAELFTDEDGDGGCWSKAQYPTWSTLNRGDPWATHDNYPDPFVPNGIDDDRDAVIDDGPTLPDGRPNPWANPESNVTNGVDDDHDGRVDDAASESSGQQQGLKPGPDGYIHYGVVRVKNNYLALYLRNWTLHSSVNRFLGLILTPRDRTSGRVNINTVETKAYPDTVQGVPVWRGFNALLGIPGVLFDEGQQYIAPDGAPTPPVIGPRAADSPPPPLPGLPQIQIDPPLPPPVTNLLDRARLIEVGRPGTWPGAYDQRRRDGRYYASISELLGVDSGFNHNGTDLHPLTIKPPELSSGIPQNAQWYDEIGTRFGEMANLITTRSDVFEILVTVQAGYAVDANGDGQINWRSNDEFIVTAEKKARSVYER